MKKKRITDAHLQNLADMKATGWRPKAKAKAKSKGEKFESFDELVGFLFEEHQASDNNPLDDSVRFEMPDGLPVTSWTVRSVNGKHVVTVSDAE